MNFITSTEMRQRDITMTEYMSKLIHPTGGWGMFYRRAEDAIPGFQMAYGLAYQGYPDIVISGTTDTKTQQHQYILNMLVTDILSTLPIIPSSDYAEFINQLLDNNGLSGNFKAVQIDTEQFLNGYGLNVRRYYGDYPREYMVFIQLVETMLNGEFPTESQPNQMLFHTKPYGYKETPNEPILSDSCVPCIPNCSGDNDPA